MNTFMAYISKNAIIIMALHVLVFKVATFVLSGRVSAYNVVPQTDSNMMWAVYTTVAIGSGLLIQRVIQRLKEYRYSR